MFELNRNMYRKVTNMLKRVPNKQTGNGGPLQTGAPSSGGLQGYLKGFTCLVKGVCCIDSICIGGGLLGLLL